MFSNLITYYRLIAGRPLLPPLTAAHHNYLGVRCVPEGEVNLGVLNGSYLQSRPSEFKRQDFGVKPYSTH